MNSLPIVEGKTGWPWTEATPPTPPTLPYGSPWPKISIVTPSFNQGQYIEETIRSVLLQGYPNLEYIIIDGGSTDGSVEIIKKYEPWLTYWVSERDRGQSYAINKGLELSTGEIMAWINSDDYYCPNAFFKVVKIFMSQRTDWVAGNCYTVNLDNSVTPGWGRPVEKFECWFFFCQYAQPGVFWKKSFWEKTNKIDESLHYSLDYELWFQFSLHQTFPYWTDDYLAYSRLQPESKTVSKFHKFAIEDQIIYRRYLSKLKPWNQFKVWKYGRKLKAMKFLASDFSNTAIPPTIRVINALKICPWLFTDLRFYYKVKRLFLG